MFVKYQLLNRIYTLKTKVVTGANSGLGL